MSAWIWLGVFIWLGYTVEAVAGFGGTVIALAMGALVLPIGELLPVLVPLSLVLTAGLSVRHYRSIDWNTLLRGVLPLMGAGMLAGYFLRPRLGSAVLKPLYGVLIVAFAARELWRLRERERASMAPRQRPAVVRTLMLVAGVTHGLFASGGPPLVYALAGSRLDKAHLRSTLLAVWVALNSVLTMMYLLDGTLLPALPRVLTYLPLLVAGVLLGEWLHRHIDEHRFRQVVFALLIVTGGVLTLSPDQQRGRTDSARSGLSTRVAAQPQIEGCNDSWPGWPTYCEVTQ